MESPRHYENSDFIKDLQKAVSVRPTTHKLKESREDVCEGNEDEAPQNFPSSQNQYVNAEVEVGLKKPQDLFSNRFTTVSLKAPHKTPRAYPRALTTSDHSIKSRAKIPSLGKVEEDAREEGCNYGDFRNVASDDDQYVTYDGHDLEASTLNKHSGRVRGHAAEHNAEGRQRKGQKHERRQQIKNVLKPPVPQKKQPSYSAIRNEVQSVDDEQYSQLSEEGAVDGKKEMSGFLDCSRLDRSVKVVNCESWTRYFVILTEGMLSFFGKQPDIQSGTFLPIETASLKEAAISFSEKSEKPSIMIHCCNGISYKLSNSNSLLIKTWFNFLKDTEKQLKEKRRVLVKIAPPPASPAIWIDKAQLVNTFQQNKAKLLLFIKKRVTRNELEERGIYKEPTFGGTLKRACSLDGSSGPPTFLRLCIDEIERRGLKEDGIYRKSGSMSAIQNLRIQIDQGVYKFDEITDVHTLTGVVKLYLRELSEPIIPSSFNDLFAPILCMNSGRKKEALCGLTSGMCVNHRNTLKYLVCHLRRVIDNEASNRMSLKNLSLIFGPTLTWNEEGGGNLAQMLTLRTHIMEIILEFHSSLFVDER